MSDNQYRIKAAKQKDGSWTVEVWECKERRETVLLYTTKPSKPHETKEEARQKGLGFLASHNKGKPYTVSGWCVGYKPRFSN
jgi:hypothetical protein